MSIYYTPIRSENIFNPNDKKPFKLSRSKIDLFIQCPRCFYLDRRLGVGRPPGFPFALNSAVDTLLKREFDIHRANGKPHPLIEKYGLDAMPVYHKYLEKWRHVFTGIQFLHEPTNFLIFGAIDDLWQNSKGEYIVVDYKATAKNERITDLDKAWHISYKRQMEIYQWLLRKNSLPVSNTGYFVYCNAQTDSESFNAKLEFDITLIPYIGNDEWVEQTIIEAHRCISNDKLPDAAKECDYCAYRYAVQKTSSGLKKIT
jgi:CRISPR/Cas system-associated exonuclease Cas4 (RecB family)